MAEESSSVSKEAIIDFTAGAIGGTCCAYVGQPLDTIKVKMQTYPNLYKSSVRCALDTFQKQGFMQFYAGAVPAASANIAETSVLFMCYGQCSKIVAYLAGVERDRMSTFHKACAGSFASFFAAFALCPLELIKCRMQTLQEFKGTRSNITPFTIIKDILKRDGPLGFYHGITSTVLREVPGYFFFFGGYELTKQWLAHSPEELEDLGLGKTIIAGGVGGISIWISIYPFDLIKSRMQVYSGEGKSAGFLNTTRMIAAEGGNHRDFRLQKCDVPQEKGSISNLKTSRQSSGIRAFYKGIGPTLFRAFPACAALFVGYEYSKEFMNAVF